jgi:hypothetical protein
MSRHSGKGKLQRVVLTAGVICLTFVLFTLNVSGDEDRPFSISTLSVADKLLHIRTQDLDGDGLKDILAVHRKGLEPDETRWVSIFWQKDNGGFSTGADQSWEIDTLAVIIDTGELTGDTIKEICFLTPDAVMYHSLSGEDFDITPKKLFDSAGLTVFPSKRNIPIVDFIRDWNDDGIDEIAIFGFDGLSIFARDSLGVFSDENRLAVELSTGMYGSREAAEGEEITGLRASFRFPATRLMDYDGDGLRDLIAVRGDRVIAYTRNPDSSFVENPSVDVMFDVRTQQEKIEETAYANTVVNDLNNDGYVDAIVTKQSSKGLSNFRCAINIYYGGESGYPEKPDQVIISEGSASETTILRDVNGDERLDMILPSIKISVTSIIRFLLTRSVPINFNIFLLNEDNRYSDRPDFSKEVKFKIDFSGETDVQAISLNGDFNGDKRKDFVFGTGEDELSIYMGVSGDNDRLFSKKPAVKIDIPAFGELNSRDLNGDGFSDMIIYYPQSKKRKGTIQVLMNQRRL